MLIRLTIGRYAKVGGTVVFQPRGTVVDVEADEFARLVEAGAAVPVTDEMAVEQR